MKKITRTIETYKVRYIDNVVVCTSTKELNKLTNNLEALGIEYEVETIENLYSLPIDLFIAECERYAAIKQAEADLDAGEVE